MTTIVTRAGKGSPLTHTEVDTNFTNLNTNKLEAGAIALGSAATPSISFTGDTNTGIYSPGADQVAVATNGTGRLFVDAAGGVTVPIRFVIGSANNVGGLSESTITTAGVFNTSRLIDGGTNPYLQTGAEAGIVYFNGDGTSVPATVFRTAGAERLRITSTGLVGIGTSSPSNTAGFGQQLQLTGNLPCISIDNTGTGANKYTLGVNASAAFGIWDNTASAHRLYITSSGSVGISTTSPAYALDVASSVAQVGNSTDAFIQYKSTAGNWHVGANSSNAYVFYSGTYGSGNERARIDSSGRLLVGTSSSFSAGASAQYGKFQVVGNSFSASTQGIVAIGRGQAAGASITSGSAIGTLVFSDSTGGEFAQIACEADAATGTNDYPGRLVFSTTADGAASPTEAMRLESNGHMRVSGTIYRDGSCGLRFSGTDLIPQSGTGTNSDNAVNLGSPTGRWATVYAGTGTINTSDANLKQDIQDLEQFELNTASAIKGLIRKFRFTDAVAAKGDDARIHVGVIAQEVEQAFIDEGLDPRRYGVFCEDTLEDGTKRLGIRYDELLAFVIAAL